MALGDASWHCSLADAAAGWKMVESKSIVQVSDLARRSEHIVAELLKVVCGRLVRTA